MFFLAVIPHKKNNILDATAKNKKFIKIHFAETYPDYCIGKHYPLV